MKEPPIIIRLSLALANRQQNCGSNRIGMQFSGFKNCINVCFVLQPCIPLATVTGILVKGSLPLLYMQVAMSIANQKNQQIY